MAWEVGTHQKFGLGTHQKFNLGTHQKFDLGTHRKFDLGTHRKFGLGTHQKFGSGNETKHTVAGGGLFCFRLKLNVLRRDGFSGSRRSGFFAPSSAGFFSPPSSVAGCSSVFASPPPVAPSSFFPSSGFYRCTINHTSLKTSSPRGSAEEARHA